MHAIIALLLLLQGDVARSAGPSVPLLADLSIGMSRSQVTRRLGPPSSTFSHAEEVGLGMGRLLELRYPGLTVWLCHPPLARRSEVFLIEARSSRWRLSGGLHVGQHRRDAIRLLGEPSSSYVAPRTQLLVLRYSGFRSFDGWLDIVIENDVVTSVSLEADWS